MKKVVVLGTFDIVHMGHIHMFKKAKEYGNHLIVVVARDKNVEIIKGTGPLHTDTERMEFLQQIKLIDEVRLGDLYDPYHIFVEVQPDVIALGYDQKIFVDNLEHALEDHNINCQIVRLAPYHEHRFKSSKFKKYIERIV